MTLRLSPAEFARIAGQRFAGPHRANKYGNRKTVVDGISFASRREAARYVRLKQMVESGEVKFFLRQTPFHLPGGVKYVADFLVVWADGRVGVEDAKGCRTRLYLTKKKMVEAMYPVTIEEV